LLRELRGASRSHYIATTVALLSTGIDLPWLQNIGFLAYIASPIRFYQMLGRGTRIAEGKLTFCLYDYTDALRSLGADFISRARSRSAAHNALTPFDGDPPAPWRRMVQVEGFDVRIDAVGHYIMIERDGKETAVSIKEYEQELAKQLLPLAPPVDIPYFPGFKSLSMYDPDFARAFLDGRFYEGLDHAAVLSRVQCATLILHANWFRHLT
jgi:type I restriction enzyme, R subunit